MVVHFTGIFLNFFLTVDAKYSARRFVCFSEIEIVLAFQRQEMFFDRHPFKSHDNFFGIYQFGKIIANRLLWGCE